MSLKKIEKKVIAGRRLTKDDALAFFESDDIFTIGRLANIAAGRKNGKNAYFIQNHHINPTNICVNRCKFCAFSRSKGEKGAYELSIREIIKKLKTQRSAVSGQQSEKLKTQNSKFRTKFVTHHSSPSYTEVHIVGGLHPDWPFEYYLEMLKKIKTNFPNIHIKAFTAVEIDYFSKISEQGITDTLKELKKAGLDSMPGGGAEIFNTQARNKICPEKITGKEWLNVMEKAHNAGIKTNATMLYGHLETYKHRVEHMLRLRELQDRTGGFQAFIPLAFHPMNTELSQKSEVRSQKSNLPIPNLNRYTSGIDDLKTIAIARLFLDNFPHIKAYWIMLGEKIAQLALMFGADDLDGTIIEEKITHSAGALSGTVMTRAQLINLIEKAGKVPVERDSFYRPIGATLRGRPNKL
ncbi:MAG: CofH family radical SAM protein [Nitrospirae bacterium]|nr:CofH family radical SAM protein [Nitrospirota bacterium]